MGGDRVHGPLKDAVDRETRRRRELLEGGSVDSVQPAGSLRGAQAVNQGGGEALRPRPPPSCEETLRGRPGDDQPDHTKGARENAQASRPTDAAPGGGLVPRYNYLIWEGSHERLGDLLAEDLVEAGRVLKRRLGALQAFVIWPRGAPQPSRHWEDERLSREGGMAKGYE